MRIFIALLIYMSIVSISDIKSYWSTNTLTIYKPMEFMPFYRFEQIKRYFHVSPLPLLDVLSCTPSRTSTSQWYMKLAPLFRLLRARFQANVILAQNVSFDEMMVPFTGRSKHTLKMKNKPVLEGFKLWALCNRGYTWDFLFYSRVSGM